MGTDLTCHVPVMLQEVVTAVESLSLFATDCSPLIVFDGTFGGGGHSSALLDLDKRIRLLAMDRDRGQIERVSKRMFPMKGDITSRMEILQMLKLMSTRWSQKDLK